MILRGGYQAIALKLQESVDSLGASDVRQRLSDCLRDSFRGSAHWAYYIDHFGDGESGDVIYSCDGDVKRAAYDITASPAGSAAKCAIDMEAAIDVVPRTIYEPEADEADHYAAMSEALVKTEKLYTELPLYERYISRKERDAASADDFAGKGRSYPILKEEDVMAAVHAIPRAGSGNLGPSGIKGRIIAIAKRKGFDKRLPKSWQTEKTSESAPPMTGSLALKESATFPIDIVLAEALTPGKKIKLISPGKGSTAYYTTEALKKAATDKIFKAGTPMRIDHPTAAEESARPEGSVKDWGAVLARDAYWLDEHVEGPGLFSEIKPFSDHAQLIEEKSPYAGVSIRANGSALIEGGKTVMREGVPVLKEFTAAEGVDMVTRAGAGGMFLREAAVPPIPTEGGLQMDAAELKKLQESLASQSAINAKLLERAIRGDARELAGTILKPLTLHEAVKAEVVTNVLKGSLPMVEGALDETKFTELVNIEAKRLGALAATLTGSGGVAGLGAPAPVVDPTVAAKETEQRKAARELRIAESIRNFQVLGMPEDAAKRAALRGEEAA